MDLRKMQSMATNIQPKLDTKKDIGWAKFMLVTGKNIGREAWSTEKRVMLVEEDGKQFLYVTNPLGDLVKWQPSSEDILAEDYKLA
jgi:hypothetical protein